MVGDMLLDVIQRVKDFLPARKPVGGDGKVAFAGADDFRAIDSTRQQLFGRLDFLLCHLNPLGLAAQLGSGGSQLAAIDKGTD